MRKIFTLIFLFFMPYLSTLPCHALSLQGGVSENIINKGFFGIWHVTCKLIESNSTSNFAGLSVHIWNLSGWGNVLVLENQLSGARSEIKVDKATDEIDGALLKFTRVQSKNAGGEKIVLTETPEITLKGDVFQGFDTFIIEKYENGVLKSKEKVKYKIVGQKITREMIKQN